MAAYVTQQDCVCLGEMGLLEVPDVERLLERASDQVDAACFGRIQQIGFAKLTQYQQDKIKKAVCLHAAFLQSYGQALNSPLESYGINGVSMSFASDRVVRQGGAVVSSEVYSLLLQTGLAQRGVW